MRQVEAAITTGNQQIMTAASIYYTPGVRCVQAAAAACGAGVFSQVELGGRTYTR